ncbi:MAG: LysR family transcriptional regulator [Spirochaetota bacterium]
MNDLKIDIGYKIWIKNKGNAFGKGPYTLLKNIESMGSLSQAAAAIKMSYRGAWGLIKTCEERLGFTLIERQVGGSSGGYSRLTSDGMEFIRWYESLNKEVSDAVEKIFNKKLNKLFKDKKK